jgi:putative methionine-R-sulfoxide reductase with GAF domain
MLSLGLARGQGPRQDTKSYKPFNSNTSNASSLLWHALHALPSPSNHTNWAGFYVFDHSRAAAGKKPQLILGPFQGKVACQVIAFGRGVCGVAAATAETQNVPDVDLFPGHIACDGASKSEIVAPIVVDGKVSFSSHATSPALVGRFAVLMVFFFRRLWRSSTSTAQSRAVLMKRIGII